MPETALPRDIVDEIADLRRRIKTLETAAPMRATSMTNGTFTVLDDAGTERVTMGLIDGSAYGLEVRNADGAAVYLAAEDGQVLPYAPLVVSRWDDAVATTSSSWETIWAGTCSYVTADAVQIQLFAAADAATTGEVRLTASVAGTPATDAITIAASSADYIEWKWAPPGLTVGVGPIIFKVEARRTSGAGNVWTYAPLQAHTTDAGLIGATSTGL